MKGKGAKKAAVAAVTAVAVCAASVGGYYGIRQAGKKTVKVYPVGDFTTGYWGDDMNMEGQITSTAAQNIYLSDNQTVSQVLVKEGDTVNAGDVLMTYDTSMIELDLETQQLQLAQTKLKIQQSEKELEKLKKTKPVSENPLDPVEPDIPFDPDISFDPDIPFDPDFPDEPTDPDEPIPTPDPEPTYDDAVLYSDKNKLTFGSKPYKGTGTKDDPYTYLCAPGTILTGGFLNQMAGYTDETGAKKEETAEGFYFRLEIHEENKAAGELETVWEQDGAKILKPYETSYEAVLSLKEQNVAEAPELKVTTPLVNTEVEEGGTLKLKIGVNEKDSGKENEKNPSEDQKSETEKQPENTESSDQNPENAEKTQNNSAEKNQNDSAENKEKDSTETKPEDRTDEKKDNTSDAISYSYVWKHNGKIIENAQTDTFTKENVTKADAGIYTVEVTLKTEKGTSFAISTANVTVKEKTPSTSPTPTPDPASTPEVTPTPGTEPAPGENPKPEKPSDTPAPTAAPEETPAPSVPDVEPSTAPETPAPTEHPSETPGSTTSPSAPETEIPSAPETQTKMQQEDEQHTVQIGTKTVFYGEKASVQSLFTAAVNDGTASGATGDDTQISYTKDELKKAISDKESQIRDLKLDQKEEELKVKNTQKSLDDQTVKALISGVVKKVGNIENPSNDGSAFIQVSGNEGLYVRGYLSETYLDQVKVGDQVNVNSWSSGAFAAATITEISPYPSNSYASYSETPASFYPFTAVIPEGGEGFENGDWVSIATTVGNDVANGNGLYISKEFIREENGQKYVYIRDANEKLKKQDIVTGKLLWGSFYEVKSGLSEEDYIAFPYGKTVVEGADTKESTSSDYYNS